jgi:hypothetical protein
MRRRALSRRRSISPRRAAGGHRRRSAANDNHHMLAPKRKRGGMFEFLIINAKTNNPTHNAPGLKNRGLRATTMNHPSQPFVDVSLTRPSAASLRQEATSNTVSRREKGWWSALQQRPLFVRQRGLFAIVLQLQWDYCCSAHGDKSAHRIGRFVRVGALTNRGAHKLRKLVRTRFAGVIANRLQLQQPRRRGGRCLHVAISAPQCRCSSKASGRRKPAVTRSDHRRDQPHIATVTSPLSNNAVAEHVCRSHVTGALRPPLASACRRR